LLYMEQINPELFTGYQNRKCRDVIMKKLEILRYPDERLKIKSEDIEIFDKNLQEFIDNLIYTMYNSPAGVGIAAPQVNKHIRAIIVDASNYKHKKNKINHGLMVLCNPRIVDKDGEIRRKTLY